MSDEWKKIARDAFIDGEDDEAIKIIVDQIAVVIVDDLPLILTAVKRFRSDMESIMRLEQDPRNSATLTRLERLATRIERMIDTGPTLYQGFRPSKPDQIRMERGDWSRASGDVVCDYCSCLYYDHPQVPGYPFIRKLCNGRLVKL